MTIENQGQAEYGNTPKSSAVKTAVLIPYHNEGITIGKVIDDFQRELPSATIYVFDNCSTDATAAITVKHGAVVIKEPRRGKGFVAESMLDRVDAALYVMVDGDDTYLAGEVHKLLDPVLAGDDGFGAAGWHEGTFAQNVLNS